MAGNTTKRRRKKKQQATFRQGQFFVNNKPVKKLLPVPIPSCSSDAVRLLPDLVSGISGVYELQNHSFQAKAVQVDSTQDIRDAYDELLRDGGFAQADFLAYAFRIESDDRQMTEDYDSGRDRYTGTQILRFLRNNGHSNIVCFIAHSDTAATPMRFKAKNEQIASALAEAIANLVKALKTADHTAESDGENNTK